LAAGGRRTQKTEANAKLSIVHVIQANKEEFRAGRPFEKEQIARHRLAELQSKVGLDAANARGERKSDADHVGPVNETLLREVSQESTDVLVIGRSLQQTAGRLGDLAYSLVRDSNHKNKIRNA
jgi:hypothetical protein